mmetsp:Transcript_25301/g.59913  ORF Transcript_25301/g.59913 Transcript_25301/m.59913 type:complete len:553 (+) Transcript_25301:199-1857(+)
MIFRQRGKKILVLLLVTFVLLFTAQAADAQNDNIACNNRNDPTCTSSTESTIPPTSKSKPTVLMASSTSSKQAELVQWIREHQLQLLKANTPLMVQHDIQTALQIHPFIHHNELNIVSTIKDYLVFHRQDDNNNDDAVDSDSDDLYSQQFDNALYLDEVLVASMALKNEISGVVYLRDVAASSTTNKGSATVVEDACLLANKPIATNIPSANLILAGVANTPTNRQNAYLLFNPVAGHGNPQEDMDFIRRTLEPNLDLTVIYTRKDRDVKDQATEIINMIQASSDYLDAVDNGGDGDSTTSKKPILIASGGDGTVSVVAGVTMGTDVPFGVIPRGTANAFSVALGIPTGVEDACKNILKGHIRTVDGAYMNETPMILLAGLGFEATMVDTATRELKDSIGALAYVYGGAKAVFDQPPFHCDIVIDGKSSPETMEMTGITVANVAPPTSVSAMGMGTVEPDDGLLEVSIQVALDEFSSLANMASLFNSIVTQQPTKTDSLLALRAKTIDISCPETQKVVVDGEMLEEKDMLFKIVENGINVLAPPAASLDGTA